MRNRALILPPCCWRPSRSTSTRRSSTSRCRRWCANCTPPTASCSGSSTPTTSSSRRSCSSAGSLSDRFGRKGMLLGGLAVFGTASAAGGLMTSSGGLIAARAVMGLGAAMVFPATLSLISNIFVERAERARAIGLWGATAGHRDRARTDRRRLAARTLLLVEHLLRDDPRRGARRAARRAGRPDLARSRARPGSTGRGSCSRAPRWRRSSTRSSRRRCTAGRARARSRASRSRPCCSPASSLRERHTDEPMLDVRLFANPRFTAASGSVTVAFFSLFGFIFLMTQYFQFIKHYGPLSAGVHLLPVATSVGRRLGARHASSPCGSAPSSSSRRGLVMVAAFYAWVAAVVVPRDGLRDDRCADGPLRRRHGPHERARDGGDHGRRAAREGRRRLGRQRHHAPARRHPRRRDHRQRLRLALLEPADRAPPRARCPPGWRRSRTTRSARLSAWPVASRRPATSRSEAASPAPPPARSSTVSLGCLVAGGVAGRRADGRAAAPGLPVGGRGAGAGDRAGPDVPGVRGRTRLAEPLTSDSGRAEAGLIGGRRRRGSSCARRVGIGAGSRGRRGGGGPSGLVAACRTTRRPLGSRCSQAGTPAANVGRIVGDLAASLHRALIR